MAALRAAWLGQEHADSIPERERAIIRGMDKKDDPKRGPHLEARLNLDQIPEFLRFLAVWKIRHTLFYCHGVDLGRSSPLVLPPGTGDWVFRLGLNDLQDAAQRSCMQGEGGKTLASEILKERAEAPHPKA